MPMRSSFGTTLRAALSDGSSYALQDVSTFRTTLGLGTGDSPQFTAINVGHASDTTLARAAAGRLSVESVAIVRGPASATDNAVARFDATTGDLIQNSGVTIDDSNNVSTAGGVVANGLSRKNAIINGDFNVWQRGTTFSVSAAGTYTADRWRYGGASSTAVFTVSRSTDVPTLAEAGRLFNYSLLADCTTADASIAAGDVVAFTHRVEGYNWLPLAQREITLSFWAKATKTGTYCVALRNSATDRSCVQEYTISVTDTWEKKTVTFPASPSAGTWDYTTGIGIDVGFCLAAGSTFHASAAGAWETGNFLATANQVNGVDDTANNFRLTGVQLELGNVATEFEYCSIQDAVLRCQRYYQKSYELATVPGTAAAPGNMVTRVNVAGQTALEGLMRRLSPPMRTAPTMVWYSTSTGAAANVRDLNAGADRAVSSTADPGEHSTGYPVTSVGITTADTFAYAHFTATAEL
jgi:hypothetical protein